MVNPNDFCDYGDEPEGCYECGGEGYVVAECFEDTCCCEDPEMEHGLIPCPLCGGGMPMNLEITNRDAVGSHEKPVDASKRENGGKGL